jgi:hypothetical protein
MLLKFSNKKTDTETTENTESTEEYRICSYISVFSVFSVFSVVHFVTPSNSCDCRRGIENLPRQWPWGEP